MYLELHILQNFAPSNLNRDDTNSPKQCDFGGYRRARVSSQSWKRAMRRYFEADGLLPEADRSMRTKRVVTEKLAPALVAYGKEPAQAEAVARALLAAAGIGFHPTTGLNQYLLFLGQREVDHMVDTALKHWDALAAVAAKEGEKKEQKKEGDKKEKKTGVPPEVARDIRQAFDGGRAASVAMFGRMLAGAADLNVDAAAQVAHAISTHAVETEFDFYTAMDDLKPDETAGADMMGAVEFNSACFYRYMNVNVDELRKNLQSDEELVRAALDAFVRSSVAAIPTGKQNSMAAHNPPSIVLAVVADDAPRNLANAFVRPISGRRGGGLIADSARAMLATREDLAAMYGRAGEKGAWLIRSRDIEVSEDGLRIVDCVDELVGQAVGTACGGE